MKRLLVIISASMLLFGCNPIVLKTVTLNPSDLGGAYEYNEHDNAACSFGDGFVNGLGPEDENPGEAYVGYDDIYNHGADPIPCIEQEQILYRGHVKFDLTQFDTIVSADLNFGISRSTLNAQPESPPECVATILGQSTGTKDEGKGPYYWDYDNDASITPMNPCQTLIPPQYSVGVSEQIREWTNQQRFNYGFILAGPILGEPGLPSDNDGHVSFYNNFQLVILYNPALNPRAPQ